MSFKVTQMKECKTIDHLETVFQSGGISLPKGMTHSERQVYIESKLNETIVIACVHGDKHQATIDMVKRENIGLIIDRWKKAFPNIIAYYVDNVWTQRSDVMTNQEHDDWEAYFKSTFRRKYEHAISKIHVTSEVNNATP